MTGYPALFRKKDVLFVLQDFGNLVNCCKFTPRNSTCFCTLLSFVFPEAIEKQ